MAPDANERTPLLASSSASTSQATEAQASPRQPATAHRISGTRSLTQSSPSTVQNLSRIDASDLDARFRRWMDHVTRKLRTNDHRAPTPLEQEPQFVVSVFDSQDSDPPLRLGGRSLDVHDGYLGDADFSRQIARVRTSIAAGLNPKMIQTGSSGSYFVRMLSDVDEDDGDERHDNDAASATISLKDHEIVAVFKPNDEEPYGDLNPKRLLLKRYLWWAMGRPCLIPSFSYLSEVAASRLDTRLGLGMVPSTRLVSLASTSFYYLPSERKVDKLREKPGSYQQFLRGYVNASSFLRANPWPSRPRELLERDIQAENTAHGRAKARARKGKVHAKSKRGKCLAFMSSMSCLKRRTRVETGENDNAADVAAQEHAGDTSDQHSFAWTSELMDDFRRELEKLVCFDYLIRNTDRGLDNFMIKVVEPSENGTARRTLKLAAIDNSLAFPWTHPAGIRSYPWGWLYLPTDLIGGPFSMETRAAFIAHLSNPSWWHQTRIDLERLFREDGHFDVRKFEGQMDVLRGQGWNLLESLRNEDEGPLELCARQKQRVTQENTILSEENMAVQEGHVFPITSLARSLHLQQNSKEHQLAAATVSKPIVFRSPDDRSSSIESATFQPSSLPADSNGVLSMSFCEASHGQNPHRKGDRDEPHNQIARAAEGAGDSLGKAYRSGSLGIDVLKGMDKLSKKSTRRPSLRKAKTGRAIPTSQPRESREPLHRSIIAEDYSDTEDTDSHGVPGDTGFMSSSVTSLRPARNLSWHRHGRQASHGGHLSIDGVLAAAGRADNGPRMIRVLIEHLIADTGIAWQTWLGL